MTRRNAARRADLVARRRARCRGSVLLALLLGLASPPAPAVGEEVLLSLPKDFDVRPIGGWGQHGSERRRIPAAELQGDAVRFRFRGEQVTQTSRTTDHHSFPHCQVDITSDQELRGTFRRGVLSGRWVSRQRNFYRSCNDRDDGEYMRSRLEGVVSGQANADGLLELTVQVTEGEIVDHKMDWVGEGNKGRFVYREWGVRDQPHESWSFGLELQLPVGELQSSQRLSTPPPRAAPAPPPPEGPSANAGRTEEPPDGAVVGPWANANRAEGPLGAPVEEQPAPPAETAGATVGSGLLLGIGAWLFARANGTGLGDLVGGLGEWLTSQPQPPPAEPARVFFEEPPYVDGERNDRGEVWSDENRGWVSPNLYAQDQERRAWLEAKDRADFEAMRQPDGLSEVARQIVAGDRRIAARAERIARRDAALRKESEQIREETEELGLDPQGRALQGLFDEHQEELARRGYRVLNPGYDQALPVREVVDAAALVGSFVRPGQAVRCVQFADLGKQALEGSLRERFGPEADGFIVDSVVVDVARDDSWSGRAEAFLDVVVPKNHVATRVVLPDGRRFVLDHWDASRGAGRRLLSEKAWFERWRDRLGEDAVFTGSGEYGQQVREERLQEAVTRAVGGGGSEEQGLASFREEEISRIQRGAGTDAEKAAHVGRVDTLVRSYQRYGGLRPGTRDGT